MINKFIDKYVYNDKIHMAGAIFFGLYFLIHLIVGVVRCLLSLI